MGTVTTIPLMATHKVTNMTMGIHMTARTNTVMTTITSTDTAMTTRPDSTIRLMPPTSIGALCRAFEAR